MVQSTDSSVSGGPVFHCVTPCYITHHNPLETALLGWRRSSSTLWKHTLGLPHPLTLTKGQETGVVTETCFFAADLTHRTHTFQGNHDSTLHRKRALSDRLHTKAVEPLKWPYPLTNSWQREAIKRYFRDPRPCKETSPAGPPSGQLSLYSQTATQTQTGEQSTDPTRCNPCPVGNPP